MLFTIRGFFNISPLAAFPFLFSTITITILSVGSPFGFVEVVDGYDIYLNLELLGIRKFPFLVEKVEEEGQGGQEEEIVEVEEEVPADRWFYVSHHPNSNRNPNRNPNPDSNKYLIGSRKIMSTNIVQHNIPDRQHIL